MRDTLRMQANDDLKATIAEIEAIEARIASCELAADTAALSSLRVTLETLTHRQATIQRFLDLHDARMGWMERTGQLEPVEAPQAAPAGRRVLGTPVLSLG